MRPVQPSSSSEQEEHLPLNPRSPPQPPPRSPPHPTLHHRLPPPTRARLGLGSQRGSESLCCPPACHLSRPREPERIPPTPPPLIRGAAPHRCQPRFPKSPTPCSQPPPSSPKEGWGGRQEEEGEREREEVLSTVVSQTGWLRGK